MEKLYQMLEEMFIIILIYYIKVIRGLEVIEAACGVSNVM